MKITGIETVILRLPEVEWIGDNAQTVLIIRVDTDEGISGIGEVHTNPLVTKAIIDAPRGSISSVGLRELLVGRDASAISAIWNLAYRHTSTYGRRGALIHALSGVEIALWDIKGKVAGLPVHQLLGGGAHEDVRAYASVLAPGGADEALRIADRHVEAGFDAIKFGWGGLGGDVRADARMIGSIRKSLGNQVDLMLDMGLPIPLRDAVLLSNLLAEHDVMFLEEPLEPDNLEGYRQLTMLGATPIAAGEKETTIRPFLDLMDRAGLHVVQPDIARVGGILETYKIGIHAEARSVRMIPHCWATDVLVAATLHVLATQKDAPLLELNVSDNPLRTSLLVNPIRVDRGRVRIPQAPGLGIDLDEETVRRYRWDP